MVWGRFNFICTKMRVNITEKIHLDKATLPRVVFFFPSIFFHSVAKANKIHYEFLIILPAQRQPSKKAKSCLKKVYIFPSPPFGKCQAAHLTMMNFLCWPATPQK